METHQVSVLDKAGLLERLNGDVDLLQEITGLFLEDYPKLLLKIRSAIGAGDAPALERAAHALKGSVANFGAAAAYAAAYRLETLGRAAQLAGAPAACADLEQQIDQFQQALTCLSAELHTS